MDKFVKVAAHGLIKRDDGKFLVILRSPQNDFLPNLWDLPGGTIEFGEVPEEALEREIFEETSLKVEIGKLIFVHTIVQKDIRHQFWIIYECKYLGGEVKLNPEEHSEFQWVDWEEAGNLNRIVFLEELCKQR